MKSTLNPFLCTAKAFLGLSFLSLHAADLTWNVASGDIWDTTAAHWLDGPNPVIWNSGTPDRAIFGSTGAGTINVGTGISANALTFETAGCLLQGDPITLAGTTPGITAHANATISAALAGTAGLAKSGSGTLTLAGSNTYTGPTTISGGALAYSGTGGNSNGNALLVGGASGRGVVNFNSSGTFSYGTTGEVRVGGNGGGGDTGVGAINQSSGNVTLARSGTYLELGAGGGGNTYGSYELSGGSLTITNQGGIRVGQNGVGSFVQSGGTLNVGRWFAIGGGGSTGHGAVTFTGGTAAVNPASGWRILVGDAASARAALNIGTHSGGDAVVTNLSTSGITLRGDATATANLNSGTLVLGGAIQRSAGAGVSFVNLNGGTLRVGVNNATLISNANGLSANVFNGGLTVDNQNLSATISANLLATTGNGIYTTGGIIHLPTPTGSGYIGAPLVTVTGGSGSGATAIANIDAATGTVAGVTLTSPGQGYLAGDTLGFAFAGGGFTGAAGTFNYELTPSDLAANGTGGLVKNGTGVLGLTGANTFTGPITINAGRLDASTAVNGGLAVNTASRIEVKSGGQFLAFAGTYTPDIDIAGSGHGEIGFPGALRLAADRTASYTGNITLKDNATIMTQRNSSFTLTGSISGGHVATFYAGDPSGDSGALTVAPLAEIQNSYTSTVIDGRANGSIVAGNTYAFSTGGLEVKSATLKLNGHSHSFANLIGTGGTIGNYAATDATLTVGSDDSSTSNASALVDGGAGKLALTKLGSGTLTLSGASTYTGDTTVSAGTLLINGALGATAITVETNGTIGGKGTIDGHLTFAAGARLDLTGATIGLDSSDILSVSSGANLTLTDFAFSSIIGWDASAADVGIYTLIEGGGAITFAGSTPTSLNPVVFENGRQGYFMDGSLRVVVIPEASAALLGGLGALLLLRRRRA